MDQGPKKIPESLVGVGPPCLPRWICQQPPAQWIWQTAVYPEDPIDLRDGCPGGAPLTKQCIHLSQKVENAVGRAGGKVLDLHGEPQECWRAGKWATTHHCISLCPRGGGRVRLQVQSPVRSRSPLQQHWQQIQTIGIVVGAIIQSAMRLKVYQKLIPAISCRISRKRREGGDTPGQRRTP